jgi:hypothetical protein
MSVRSFWYAPLIFILLLSACTLPSSTEKIADQDTIVINKSIDGNGETGITGQIVSKLDGTPIIGAYVNIYPDTLSNLLGPSQFISSPTGNDGRFMMTTPPGTYYVVARKRMSGEPSGPLSPGDLFSEHQRVITTVTEGRLSLVDLSVAPVKAPMFFKKAMGEQETRTGIRGVLVDDLGKPVPGSFAVAYTDTDIKRLPDYASTLSDSQGRFVLYLPDAGEYYLGARVHAWDMPHPGELYGKYGDETPIPVSVTKGQFVSEIKIILTPFTGEYKAGKSRRPY